MSIHGSYHGQNPWHQFQDQQFNDGRFQSREQNGQNNSFESLMNTPPVQSTSETPNMDMGSMPMGDMPVNHSGSEHLKSSGLMMPGDAQQDFTLNNPDGNYELSSYISANENVVQDAAERILAASPQLAQYAAQGDQGCIDLFENWIAQELTNINDVENIQNLELRNNYLSEAAANGLSAEEIDHLLHTPIAETGAGGLIDENSSISGSLHTVDLNRTRAQSMGDGTYKVDLVSNNGANNAHDNMNISTFYTEAGSEQEAISLVNNAATRGGLDANGRYNLTDAGMNILMSNLQNYA